ncbi:hypothetical protein Tco_0415745 [Tanacetum coccineum]
MRTFTIVGSSKKAKIVESKNANHSEPNHTWGSNAIDIPSSSSLVMTGCPDCSLVSGLGFSKHITGNRSQLMNFVSKFLGTVRFGNNNIVRIIGYGDYQLGNVTISRVFYVEGLGHNLFSVGQFCDADLEVTLRKSIAVFLIMNDLSSIQASKTLSCSGLGLHSMTPATSSFRLIPNSVSQQPCIPPNRDDWDHLFQPMFDEDFNPPTIVVSFVLS